MSSLRYLESILSSVLVAHVDPPAVTAAFNDELKRLSRMVGAAGGGKPAADYMRAAVHEFRATGRLSDLKAARAVCFGAVEPFDRLPPVIEHAELFPRLLDGADAYRGQPRRYRRCYRGLLHAYFMYDGEDSTDASVGAKNWTILREYLAERRRDIRADGPRPEWAEAIDDHHNLLTASPADRYGPDLLAGKNESVNELRARLEIHDDSWLIRKLVLSQVHAATRESHVQFRGRVEALLNLLRNHPALEDEGLTLVLNRYSEMPAREQHTGLRDRSVECWGNPWLELKAPAWSRVKPEARAMITEWLKIDLINQFFEVLAEDRGTDQRRLKFWLQYHDVMHDMYFALGASAMNSRGPDIKSLRQKMGGHLLGLTDAGGPRNNAFIMMIGNLVIVEFGAKGNACFVFNRETLPFRLHGGVRGDSQELKHDGHKERLLHVDGWETWEQKFAGVLARLGIRPGEKPRIQLRSDARPASGTPLPTSSPATPRSGRRRVTQPSASKRPTRAAVNALCRQYRIKTLDLQGLGGNFWVLHNCQTGVVVEQLEAWGFEFSTNRGGAWWRKGLV